MSINVNEFLSLINSKGVAQPNRYMVSLPPIQDVDVDLREMNLLCNAINLPGKQILTSDFEVGMKFEKIAYGYAVDDISLNFTVLNDFKVKEYFERWSELVINFGSNELKYKNTYQKDLEVFHLDKMGNKIYGCKLFEAFPTTLNPIEMGNANTDQATEYNVQLSYTTWKPIYFGQEGQKKPPPTSAAKEDFRRKEAAGIPTYPTY